MADLTQDWRGRKVTVMGLGRFGGGIGVTRWLAGQGAQVTVSDQATAEDLANSIAAIQDLPVRLHLGGHLAADFTDCDLLVVNPAVPFDSPHLSAARSAGVAMTTEINLFLTHCPAPVVGITGSAGKSTTTAMTAAVLGSHLKAHLGGNIGVSLLESLPQIAADHVVVLELSSFQLYYLPLLGKSPHVAVVTNLQPNHIDRHGSMEHYGRSKRNIFLFQGPRDVLVLNRDDPATAGWADQARGKVALYSHQDEPFELALPGEHNQANAQAAWTAARQFGMPRQKAAGALKAFAGLKHRLQLVATHNGVRFYNDSKCTTPDEGVVALKSFPPRSMVVIAGGYDKQVSLDSFCVELARRARAVVATGQTGPAIAAAVKACAGGGSTLATGGSPTVVEVPKFADAVLAARNLARPGEVVLLAPACASFDQFKNYEQRGDEFIRLVVP